MGSIPVPYDSSVKRMGVAVVSGSPELAALLQNAFRIHGAFDLAAPGAAQYTLRADLAPGGRVTIAVEPKALGGASFTTTGSGANWHEAAYRAADEVVEKLTTYPGFFAGRLAYVSQRTKHSELYTSDVLGQDIRQLTADHSTSVHPRWSADGSKLVYTSYYRSGFPDVILYNLTAQTRSAIANYKGTNTGAAFSPDGRSIAMILSYTGTPQLYVADANGKNLRALTHSSSLKASPTWSPDGRQIILDCDPQGEPLLYQISAAGGPLQPVQTGLPRYSAEPAWNPRDPALVAFMEQAGSQYIAVYSFKTHSSEIYDAVDGSQPCWANDGRHIFFTHHSVGVQDQLYLLDTVTKKVSKLTSLGASEPAFYYPAK